MALATLDDVVDRLEDEPTPEVEAMIEAYLEDASDKAVVYGPWSEADCPAAIRRLVAAAVARFIRNPDGFAQSRAGDETLAWQDLEEIGSVYFTRSEIEYMQTLGNPRLPAFGTIQITAHGTTPPARDTYWPTEPRGRMFPLFRGY